MILNKDWKSIFGNIRDGNRKKLIESSLRYFYRWRPPEGVRVVEEDWDFLIVLDACRYDFFKQACEEKEWLQKGKLSKKTSRGSTSIEWLNRNFVEYYDDIVYISGNAFVSPIDNEHGHYKRKKFDSNEHFHKVFPLYMEDSAQEGDVTKPEAMKEKFLQVEQEFTDKRIIAHFMQPHAPYIGRDYYAPESNLVDLYDEGKSWEEIRKYYRANLDRVLDSIRDIVESLEGKIVITADHGELLGEYGMHTHPHSIYVPELIEVPWLEIEQGERRGFSSDEGEELDIDF